MSTVLPFLRENPPRSTLYFQNQSLNPILRPTEPFAELLELLADYSHDQQLDVRIIFRNIGPVRKKLESLQAAGFNMKRVRMQSGCHTKGIIVDSKAVLIGSHNVTNQGLQSNRDASVLIRNADIAGYFERIFLHDWDRLARATINEEATPRLRRASTEASGLGGRDLVAVPWSAYAEE
jgi:phosphatidylserine/phosphatidylglycerophosphate/cardiolipin synthase-like enzyme